MYKLLKDMNGVNRTDMILRISDNAFIPNNLGNRDWVAYQLWLSQGNTPEAA